MNLPINKYPIVCFGEILWDVLPTGTLPGGAPMNVAYHLKKLGVNPALITRVGVDERGQGLIHFLEENNISTDFFQFDNDLPTGIVNAAAGENNETVYDIIKPVAWDHIQWDPHFENVVSNAAYFVFGSLITRSEESCDTLFRLLDIAKFKVLDINLRPPHFNRQIIEKLLMEVQLLKLNLAELELITGWFANYDTEIDRIKILQDKFHIPRIVVTKGNKGSIFNLKGDVYEHPGFEVQVADTTGSGDAFLASLLSRLLAEEKPQEALRFANATGAFVASQKGACPEYSIKQIQNLIETGAFQ